MTTTSTLARQFPDFTTERVREILKRMTISRYHPDEKMTRKAQAEVLGLPQPVLTALLHVLEHRTPFFVAKGLGDSKSGWIQGLRASGCQLQDSVTPYYLVLRHAVLSVQGVVEGERVAGLATAAQPDHWPEKYKAKAQQEQAAYLETYEQLAEHLAPAIALALNDQLQEMRKSVSLQLMTSARSSTYGARPVARNKYQSPVSEEERLAPNHSSRLLVRSMADVQQFVEDLLVASGRVPAPAPAKGAKPGTPGASTVLIRVLVKTPGLCPELAPIAQWVLGKKGALLAAEITQVAAAVRNSDFSGFSDPQSARDIGALFNKLVSSTPEEGATLMLSER